MAEQQKPTGKAKLLTLDALDGRSKSKQKAVVGPNLISEAQRGQHYIGKTKPDLSPPKMFTSPNKKAK